jgi:putative transcriptional regulator
MQMMEAPSVLTNRLSRLMGERRASVQDVTRATGLAYKTVADLYHARSTRIDLHTLDALCRYFRVGPEQIFEWSDERQERQERHAHGGSDGE